ncbi:Receptor-like serine/threonine-protein kinase [Heracleum sosnowskyi]|uniref:Receptor-like serine/threonine-protein kinase n=1 Tax=Heracleum sosnowskyi TaxID=360622 RepID=A0AAD8JKW7_9APIA|nr:Receptor-like serine/threonine-protein kinase [Heracleum sosnowskyi]
MNLVTKKTTLNLLVLLLCFLCFGTHLHEGTDVITVGHTLSGNQTISSKGGTFELGFFTPGFFMSGQSRNYYIGIWYKNFVNKTVVWVANTNRPVSDPFTSELVLFPNGNLALLDESRIQIWSSNSKATTYNSTLAILLDNGNFVTRDDQDSSNIIWQSFDYPTDTWLPGGKIGYNKIKKEKIYLTPWQDAEYPTPGSYSLQVETNRTSLIIVVDNEWNHGTLLSTGAWTGTNFLLVPDFDRNAFISNFKYFSDANEIKFTYDAANLKRLTRFTIGSGRLQQFVCWGDFPECQWRLYWDWPNTQCDIPNFCGAFGTCNPLQVFPCDCLPGYERVPKNWTKGDYTHGCIRKSPLECGVEGEGKDTFLSINMEFSSTFTGDAQSIYVESEKECKSACLRNCTCTGFAFYESRFLKCVIWNGKVYNMKLLSDGIKSRKSYSDDFFRVRISKSGKASKISVWIAVAGLEGFIILLGRRNMELLDDGDYFPALVADKVSKGEEVLMQFLDHRLEGVADSSEVGRACKVACWCIQDDEKNRPTMELVIQIFEGISEVGIPPFPQFLIGFTKYNTTQSVVYQHYTSNTTSSDS